MKVTLDIDLEQYRLSLIGDGYVYEEVKDLSDEELIKILQRRLTDSIYVSYWKTIEWGLVAR
jgi:hypothetical protein